MSSRVHLRWGNILYIIEYFNHCRKHLHECHKSIFMKQNILLVLSSFTWQLIPPTSERHSLWIRGGFVSFVKAHRSAMFPEQEAMATNCQQRRQKATLPHHQPRFEQMFSTTDSSIEKKSGMQTSHGVSFVSFLHILPKSMWNVATTRAQERPWWSSCFHCPSYLFVLLFRNIFWAWIKK